MISIVAWLWNDGSRDYQPQYVNTQARMLARQCSVPHRFICVPDSGDGLSSDVIWFETPAEAKRAGCLKSPEGARFPSCYRRLWTFSEDAKALGERVLLLDIDLVATDDIAPICSVPGDFVGWRPRMRWGTQIRLGGGIYMLRPGSHTEVWTAFKGQRSIDECRRAGYRGSDQAWISYRLGASAQVWSDSAGIYSIRDIKDGRDPLPRDARIVQFNGPQKPWNTRLSWARKHWC